MEEGASLLDTLFEEENDHIGHDIEMFDAEEGELLEPMIEVGERCNGGNEHENEESGSKKSKRKNRKKKNRRKRSSSTDQNGTNINRFVADACKCLRERKSYLIWTAVGCLGVPALSNLLKEVDAIGSCGGQKTADGSRFRNGGGILWNLIKVRDPNAYKEIMKKGKEFEKQFKQQANLERKPKQEMETPSDHLKIAASKDVEALTDDQQKRVSVHDRIRAPISYDDLLGGDHFKDQ